MSARATVSKFSWTASGDWPRLKAVTSMSREMRVPGTMSRPASSRTSGTGSGSNAKAVIATYLLRHRLSGRASASAFGFLGLSEVFGQWGHADVFPVVEFFGNEAADTDLAEVVEEGADFFGGSVNLVGVLVEEGQEQLFAAFAVAGLAGTAGTAGEVLDGAVDVGGFVQPGREAQRGVPGVVPPG